jgi:type III secretory pathway component EscU
MDLNNTTNTGFTLAEAFGTPKNPTWGGTVITLFGSMFFIMFVFILFAYAISNYERYKKVKGWAAYLLKSTAYFAVGILTLVVMAIPVGVCYYFIDNARSGNVVPIWITLSLIAGYVIISLIGWWSQEYLINKVMKYEKKESKKEKNKDKGVKV